MPAGLSVLAAVHALVYTAYEVRWRAFTPDNRGLSRATRTVVLISAAVGLAGLWIFIIGVKSSILAILWKLWLPVFAFDAWVDFRDISRHKSELRESARERGLRFWIEMLLALTLWIAPYYFMQVRVAFP